MAWVDMREPSQSSSGGKVNVWCRSLDWSMAGGQGLLVRVRGLLGRDLWWGRGCGGVMMGVVVGWVLVGLGHRCRSLAFVPP